MMKITHLLIFVLLSLSIVHAISQQEINDAINIINSKIDCNDLSTSQLEIVGEYYMEQMMPGDAHKRAHQMMGLEEGTEKEEQFHVDLARRTYCNGNTDLRWGMMGRGMMGTHPYYYVSDNISYLNMLWFILSIGIIIFLVWIAYQYIGKGKKPDSAISILQKRYAKGKITKKQFEDIKKEIED